MVYVPPAAKTEAAAPAPISAKKEFELIIRSIRRIAASSRAFSGELIQALTNETKSLAETQERYSWAGSAAQVSIPIALLLWKGIDLQIGTKFGEAGQAAFSSAQFGHQASSQRIQQALGNYNAFDQRMQSLMSTIDSMQQRLQQKEMEEASNR